MAKRVLVMIYKLKKVHMYTLCITYRLHQNQHKQTMMRPIMMISLRLHQKLHQKELYDTIRMADPESV